MLYGVQYRDMHTAIHNVIVMRNRVEANKVLRAIHRDEVLPGSLLSGMYEDIVEIDYRHPPSEYGGERLRIVNNDTGLPTGVPDCY